MLTPLATPMAACPCVNSRPIHGDGTSMANFPDMPPPLFPSLSFPAHVLAQYQTATGEPIHGGRLDR